MTWLEIVVALNVFVFDVVFVVTTHKVVRANRKLKGLLK